MSFPGAESGARQPEDRQEEKTGSDWLTIGIVVLVLLLAVILGGMWYYRKKYGNDFWDKQMSDDWKE